jgi:hypothetical protein
MNRKHTIQFLIGLTAVFLAELAMAAPVGTAFTYQGQLKNAGSPANGNTNMSFSLWDAASGGTQQGSTLTFTGGTAVNVSNGLFSVQLDFGVNPYTANAARWLEISVNGTPLTPRQPLAPTPFALNTRGVIVDSSGKVGIGTAAPAEALEVRADGTATAIRFGGPFGTGSLYAGSGSVGINAGDGTTGLSIDQTNKNVSIGANVGIGTVTPIAKLHVNGGPAFQHLRIDSSNSQGTWFNLNDTDTDGRDWALISTGSVNGEGAGKLLIRDNTTPSVRMTFDTTGNVGIGTTSPTHLLHVSGGNNSTEGIYIEGDDTGLFIKDTGGSASEFKIFNNDGLGIYQVSGGAGAGVRMQISEATGNVGIGTTSPASKLDVRGDVKLGSSGQYFAMGGDENLRIIRGIVDNNGNVLYGSGYSVVRNSTGTYTVTFSPGFSDVPALLVTPFSGGTPRIATTNAVSAANGTALLWTTGGALVDTFFSFTAIGPK